jgi:hypothetical protein
MLRRVSIAPEFGFFNIFPAESGFDSCNRCILVNFINGRSDETSLRCGIASMHVMVKCHLRVWINAVIAFDSNVATPALRLIAKRAAKLKALVFLKITNGNWDYHRLILIHFPFPDTVVSEAQPMTAFSGLCLKLVRCTRSHSRPEKQARHGDRVDTQSCVF